MDTKAKPMGQARVSCKRGRKTEIKAKKTANAGTKAWSPPKAGATGKPASQLIDQVDPRPWGGMRGETLARMRVLILEADPEMTEEWKWVGSPVWSHHGIVYTGAPGRAYTKVVKLTFARGAGSHTHRALTNCSPIREPVICLSENIG